MSKISFEKKGIVEETSKRISGSPALLITNHQKLTVAEVEELREELASVSASYLGVKNTLLKIALKKIKKNFSFGLSGQTGVCYGEDIEKLARASVAFRAKHTNFDIQGGIVDKEFFSAQYIEELALLPSKEVLITHLLNTMQLPLSNLGGLLKEHLRRLVRVIGIIKKQ